MEEQKQKGMKPSYEELVEENAKLTQRLKMAINDIQRIDAANAIQRLNFLFKVVENYAIFDSDFIQKCVNEIQNMLTIDEDSDETQTEE